MKSIFMATVWLFCMGAACHADVSVNVLGKCDDILNGIFNSNIDVNKQPPLRNICNSPNAWNCGSYSGILCGLGYEVINARVGLTGTQSSKNIVMCLPASGLCSKINRGCPDTYAGLHSELYMDSMSYGTQTLHNDKFFECCQTCDYTEWQNVSGKNYQVKYAQTCSTDGTCKTLAPNAPVYRCNSGYYGTGGNCYSCPPQHPDLDTGGLYITSDAGAERMEQCYIMGRISYGDDSGMWGYTENCYYK